MHSRIKRPQKNIFKTIFLLTNRYTAASSTIFAKTVTREKRIPFEVTADPFYSKSNIDHLKKVIKSIEDGTAKLEKHDLVNVKKYENGCILLEPYELVRPDTISEKTLAEMDNAAANFKSDNVSSDIDFSDFQSGVK